jgi:hypothetical protein
MSKSLAITLTLLSVITSTAPAMALDFDSLLQNYIGRGKISTSDQALIKTNINTRQAQLETDIQSAADAGQLTAQEEAELRTQLNSVASMEGNFLVDGTLSSEEVQTLVEALTQVTRKLHAYQTNATTANTNAYRSNTNWRNYMNRWSGKGDGTAPNQRALQANIDARQAQLDAQIEANITSGKLNSYDATKLRYDMNIIKRDEVRFLADGHLSFNEEKQLVDALTKLESDINAKSVAWNNNRWGNNRGNRGNRRWRDVDSRQAALNTRISQGVSSGRLTSREAEKLRRMNSRIEQMEAQLRASGNRMTYTEERQILAELDNLSDRINKELNDHQVR